MRKNHLLIIILSVFLYLPASYIKSQPPHFSNSAEIQLAINKLNVLGKALYVASHLYDKNSAVLAYLSKKDYYALVILQFQVVNQMPAQRSGGAAK